MEDERLNDQQRKAVSMVLNSRDFICGIEGRAGTGKTTLLNELRQGIKAGTNRLMAFAPTSDAAREVLRNEGFKNAETIAKLLKSEALQKEARGAVWLVDEAGLLSARAADRLIRLAANLEARLIFVADTAQHHAVERGQAFEHLKNKGGMEVAEVSKIQRQKGVYRRFVEQVISGDIAKAIGTLQDLQWINEMPQQERMAALADDYVSVLKRGQTAIVTAPTHVECAEVTAAIRKALKREGMLKDGVEWGVLKNLSWTDAQKCDADHYQRWMKEKRECVESYVAGPVVEFNRDTGGFLRGEQAEIIGVRDGMVRVRRKCGYDWNIKALPLSEPDAFNVYEQRNLEISEGDRLRITSPGRISTGHTLNTGKFYSVDYISHDGKIVLENGWKLDRDFKHFEYGHVPTSYGAQGKTVDWVFCSIPAELSSCATDLRHFYVATSRGRKGVKVYTDDIELLKENVSQARERLMATELFREPEKKPVAEMQNEIAVENEIRVSDHLGMEETAELAGEADAELQRIMAGEREIGSEQKEEIEM